MLNTVVFMTTYDHMTSWCQFHNLLEVSVSWDLWGQRPSQNETIIQAVKYWNIATAGLIKLTVIQCCYVLGNNHGNK